MSATESAFQPGNLLKLAELQKFFSELEQNAVPQVLLQCSKESVESLLVKLDEIMSSMEAIRSSLVTAILRDFQTALMKTSPSKTKRRQDWINSRRQRLSPPSGQQNNQQQKHSSTAEDRGTESHNMLNETVRKLQEKKLIPSRLVWSLEAKLDAFRRNLDKLQRSSEDLVVQMNCLMTAGGYGGENKALIFKEAENEWSSVAPLEKPRLYSAAVEWNRKMVICGGVSLDSLTNKNSVEQFCAKANSWTPMPDMLEARAGHAIVNAAGTLYVVGGWNGQECLRNAEKYNAQSGNWKRIANLITAREGLAATSYENIVVVTGGFNSAREVLSTCEAYDVKKRLWRYLPPLNIGRAYHAAASHAGVLYVFGGRNKFEKWTSVAETEQFDCTVGKWTTLSPLGRLRVARCELAAACVRGRIYLVGGCEDSQFLKSDVVEYFDTLDRQVYSARPLPEPSRAQVAVSVNVSGLKNLQLQTTATVVTEVEKTAKVDERAKPAASVKVATISRNATFSKSIERLHNRESSVEQTDNDSVYAASQSSKRDVVAKPKELLLCVGGWSNSENAGKETLIFDSEGNGWKAAAQTALQHAYTAATLWNGKVVVCGNSLAEPDSVEQFDPVTNTWSALPKLQVGRHGHSLVNLDGNLYAIGGWNGDECLSGVERYDAQVTSWKQVAGLISARKYLAGAICKRFIIVCGGKNLANHSLPTCELYDPNKDLWNVMAPMNNSRYLHAAVSHNKSVYVFGGSSGSKSSDEIEQYKAGAEKWTVLKTRLSAARFELAAACVNEKIYIVGGCDWKDSEKSKRLKLDVVDCFDPKRKQCTRVSQLPMPCRGLAAASICASLDLLDRDKRESFKSFTYRSLDNEHF